MARIVPHYLQKNVQYLILFLTICQKMRNSLYCSSLSSKRCARNAPYCSSLSSKKCAIPHSVPHYLPKNVQCHILFLTIFPKMCNAPYCSSLSSQKCAMPHIVPYYLPKNVQCHTLFLTIFQKCAMPHNDPH